MFQNKTIAVVLGLLLFATQIGCNQKLTFEGGDGSSNLNENAVKQDPADTLGDDIPAHLDPNDPDYRTRQPVEEDPVVGIPPIDREPTPEQPVTPNPDPVPTEPGPPVVVEPNPEPNPPIIDQPPADPERDSPKDPIATEPETPGKPELEEPEIPDKPEQEDPVAGEPELPGTDKPEEEIDEDVAKSPAFEIFKRCKEEFQTVFDSNISSQSKIIHKHLNIRDLLVPAAQEVYLHKINAKRVIVEFANDLLRANHINAQTLLVRSNVIHDMEKVNTRLTCVELGLAQKSIQHFNSGSVTLFGHKINGELEKAFVPKVHKVNGSLASENVDIDQITHVNGGLFVKNAHVIEVHKVNGTIIFDGTVVESLTHGNGKIILLNGAEVRHLEKFNGTIEHR